MGLNIKNERITALVRQLAKRTSMTQTGAIEEAVRSKLAELDEENVRSAADSSAKHARARQLLDELRRSLTATERSELRAAEDKLYDDAGLPA